MFSYLKGWIPGQTPGGHNSYTDCRDQVFHRSDDEEEFQGGSQQYDRFDSRVGKKGEWAEGRMDTQAYDDDPPSGHRHRKKSYRSEHKGMRSLDKRKAEESYVKEVGRLMKVNKELEDDSKASKATIQDLKIVINDMKSSVAEHEAGLRAARDATLRLEDQTKRHLEELQRLKVELRQAETHHEQTRRLLEERTKELSGAQKFLTRTDSLSGADVISMVNSLNAEVLQAAASMAESLEFTYNSLHTEAQKNTAHENAAYSIGIELTSVFTSRSKQRPSDFDPTLVQIALQICIARYCAKFADCWSVNNRKFDQGLKEMYKRMCEKEKPAVSGRWRSLTRIQARNNEYHQVVLSYIVERVTEVLFVAGWSGRGASSTKPGFDLERLNMIVDLVLRLNAAIGEDITSVDILPITVQESVKFDPTAMEDTYAADVEKVGHHASLVAADDFVVGTTDLGLQRISRDIGTGARRDVLLKSKVILRSAIQEFVN